jgi:hypothetical protein
MPHFKAMIFKHLIAIAILLTTALPAMAADGNLSAAPAPVTVMPPNDKNTFHIYLLMAQSNMVGRDTRELRASSGVTSHK